MSLKAEETQQNIALELDLVKINILGNGSLSNHVHNFRRLF